MAEEFVVLLNTPAGEKKLTASSPLTIAQLKLKEGIQGDLIFTGGKKLKDSDSVPFNSDKVAKCRVFGGSFASKPNQRLEIFKNQPIESPLPQQSEKTKDHIDADILSGEIIIIKGLKNSSDVTLEVKAETTYYEIKQLLLSRGFITDLRSIRFLGKGGKQILDSQLVQPGSVVRAIRTEFAHDELLKKQEIKSYLEMLETAEKAIIPILKRFGDEDTLFFEKRRIQAEIKDLIRYLEEQKIDDTVKNMKERALKILKSLDS